MAAVAVTSLSLSHMPEQPVYASLFRKVKNAPQILAQVKAAAAKPTVSGGADDGGAVSKEAEEKATQRADLDYAFLDASSILSITHLLAAVFRALSDKRNNRDKTKNSPVHPEIVFCLGPNNNIAYAFEKFGIGENTKDLLVLKVPPIGSTITAESISNHLASTVKVQGDSVPFDDAALLDCTDVGHIKEIYKLNDKGESAKGEKQVRQAKADKKAEKQARRRRDKDEAVSEGPETGLSATAPAQTVESVSLDGRVGEGSESLATKVAVEGDESVDPNANTAEQGFKGEPVNAERKLAEIRDVEIVVLGIITLRGS